MMAMKKKIILSYDYELFFGEKSGTVRNSIIEPTNKLLDVMERNGLRGNFFVDFLMFRELEKQTDDRSKSDLKLLKDQIHDIVKRGHRVELHLHPHWIDAKYNGDGTWDFSDFSHYSLSSLDEGTITEMFVEGTDYLNSLARDIDADYKIVAFRAGGWAVQPFDKLKSGFIKAGIKIDSSASLGAFCDKPGQEYNFMVMPNKAKFNFESDVCKEREDGQFLEVPITSFHKPFALFCYERIVKRYIKKKLLYSDGTHQRKGTVVAKKKSGMLKITDKFNPTFRQMLNFSALLKVSLWYTLRMARKQDIYCFIDHPKDVTERTLAGIDYVGKYSVSVNYVDLI